MVDDRGEDVEMKDEADGMVVESNSGLKAINMASVK